MRQLTQDFIRKAKAEGYRVFISQGGEFGIISTQDGRNILSFGYDIHQIGMHIATCYKCKPGYCEGSGRIIAKEINDLSQIDLKSLMIAGAKETKRTRPETLDEHLYLYYASHYIEI